MSLLETLNSDLIVALKKGDKVRAEVIRGLKSDIKYKEIDKREPLTEEDVLGVLAAAAKRRRDSIEQFQQGGRDDLVLKESGELEIITSYLPQQLSDEQLQEIVEATLLEIGAKTPADLGKVMKEIMPKVKGRADGNRVRQMIALKLSS
ncbi:MAG: GatB/YqeY domain-containing protein [Candidatus Zixiibacteriota bacterium]|nr:MAG: GatB/YqeY domain-containing protein [candidate division Zixibacteria bacterium]